MSYKSSRNQIAPGIDLFTASFLLLFFELVLFRWVPASIRLTAYFSNVLLISCFLGCGVGCISKNRRDVFILFPVATAALILLCRAFWDVQISNAYASSEFIFSGAGKLSWLYVMPLIFIFVAIPFVCLGQEISRHLDKFRPLAGYSLNIAGSLAGTVVFGAFSLAQANPTTWFTTAFLSSLWLCRRDKRILLTSSVVFSGCLWIVNGQQRQAAWSPYYMIQVAKYKPFASGSFSLSVNHDYHQYVLNLSRPWSDQDPGLHDWRQVYDFPYHFAPHPLKNVLILGAGTGNDVAAALRNGAEHVEAVELDPLIREIGVEFHPEHPYQDSRVKVHINDARYFLRGTQRSRYDLIVIGWLDSHRLFSSLSNIRQDNFVYTEESFAQINRLLADNGLFALSFYVSRPWVAGKLFSIIRSAFGVSPQVFYYPDGGYGYDGHIFLAGPALSRFKGTIPTGFKNLNERYMSLPEVPVPTDDWPYLYYKDHRISFEYGMTIILLMLLSSGIVAFALPKEKSKLPENAHFFFLGAGFMLLETRNITALALLYGSTWIVTSVVISAILAMVLFANGLVGFCVSPGRKMTWSLLLTSILAAAVCKEQILPGGSMMRAAEMTLVVSLSFLFSGLIFADSFNRASIPSRALGFNILGSVAGGLAEYASLILGIHALLWIAIGLYLAAWGIDLEEVVVSRAGS